MKVRRPNRKRVDRPPDQGLGFSKAFVSVKRERRGAAQKRETGSIILWTIDFRKHLDREKSSAESAAAGLPSTLDERPVAG
jgi:hypothetical protein